MRKDLPTITECVMTTLISIGLMWRTCEWLLSEQCATAPVWMGNLMLICLIGELALSLFFSIATVNVLIYHHKYHKWLKKIKN